MDLKTKIAKWSSQVLNRTHKNYPQPTLQTLPLDCLLEILQYVPLPECMFLRSSCRHLKTAVDEHFRTGVRTLPVLLSAFYLQKKYYQQPSFSSESSSVKISFGSASGVWQRTIYENKEIYPSVEKFRLRSENYLILSELAKFDVFMDFITKYLPGITKLELIIDHNDHLNNISRILNLYRKQLRILLLERTTRCSEWTRFLVQTDANLHDNRINVEGNKEQLPMELFNSINSLDALEKLYFFSKWTDSIFKIFDHSLAGYDKKLPFFKETVSRLKVLHLPEIYHIHDYFEPNINVDLEELGVYRIPPANLRSLESSFLKLEEFIVFGTSGIEDLEPKLMPNLKVLRLCHPEEMLKLTEETMRKLNDFENLEKIYCSRIHRSDYLEVRNESIKYIEISKFGNSNFHSNYHLPAYIINKLKRRLRFFTGLEKVIVRKPFIELTGSEIGTINNCLLRPSS